MPSQPTHSAEPARLKGEARRIADRLAWNLSGQAIEQESFRIIEAEFGEALARFAPAERLVARRLVHASADPSLLGALVFQRDPVAAGLAALRAGAPLWCDASMIKAGISEARLKSMHPAYRKDAIACYIQDPDVAASARAAGTTRALACAEKARPLLDGGVVLVGNAPLALARIARYILEEGARPALVIGMPVGFVNVEESKDLLLQTDAPAIVLAGRRGGSTLAVACLHAVIEAGSLDAGG